MRRGSGAPGGSVAAQLLEPRILPTSFPTGEPGPGDEKDDDDGQDVDDPQQVAGAFLTSMEYGDSKAMFFDDVLQGQADTCVFASALSAAARTSLDLASRIKLVSVAGSTKTYEVKLYKPATTAGKWVLDTRTVTIVGDLTAEDYRAGESDEIWPAVFQRAYLALAASLGQAYNSGTFAFETLFGTKATRQAVVGDLAQAKAIKSALTGGAPVFVSSNSGSPLLETTYGIVAGHCYTVLGIEIPSNNDLANAYISLRNPWGRDTSWRYFDADHSGGLNTEEKERSTTGVDGGNDGILRVKWNTFKQNFDTVLTANYSGPNINNPRPANRLVAFTTTSIPTATIYQGQRFDLKLKAVDPDGVTPFYSVLSGPGYINPLSGMFTWEPTNNHIGKYRIGVWAETGPYEAATMSFLINVVSGAPRIGSLQASPTSIKNNGSDLLTLTAQNVVTDFDTIDGVDFWRDVDGNGLLTSADALLGEGVKSGSNWSWSGYVGGLTVGTARFFARARRFSFQSTFYSTPRSVSVTVTQAPNASPVAIADAPQVQVTSSTLDEEIVKTATDAAGNIYHLTLQDVTSTTRRFLVRKLNAAGTPVVAETVPSSSGFAADLVVNSDGSFAVVWRIGSSLKVRFYGADGIAATAAQTLVTNAGGTTEASFYVKAAANSNGDLFITYNRGDYFAEDVWAISVARNGTVTRAAWRVNTNTNLMQRSAAIALNASGTGVITWYDVDLLQLRARTISQYGVSNGPEFIVATAPADWQQWMEATAVVASDGKLFIAWTQNSLTVPGLMYRQFDVSGSPIGATMKANTFSGGDFRAPMIALSTSGWMTICWTNTVQDGTATYDPGVYAQVIDPAGAKAGPEFAVPGTKTSAQWSAGMLMDADADLLFSWNHYGTIAAGHVRSFTVDSPPAFISPPTFTIPENSLLGTVVGAVQATDLDGNVITFDIPTAGPFAIHPTTGQIIVASSSLLDFETLASHTITVRASSTDKSTLKVVTISLTDANDAPSISSTQLPVEYFTTTSPASIAPTSAVIDADSSNFDGGTLVVSITKNRHAADRLQLINLGASDDVVRLSGSTLSFAGVPIGTLVGGADGAPLLITFNANASAKAVQVVLRQIGFSNTDKARSLFERTLSVVLTDGDGGTSTPLERRVLLSEFNKAPTVTGFTGTATFTENAAPTLLASSAAVTDLDSADFDGGQIVVALTAGATADDRLGILNVGVAAGQIGTSGANLLFGGVLIGTFAGGVGTSPLIVQLNAAATQAVVTAVLRNITFSNVSDSPSTVARTAQVTVSDGDGGQATVTKLANVKPVNDAPIITLGGSPAIYSKAIGNVLVAPIADVTDVDSADFSKGKLTVALAATNRDTGDRLSIRNQGMAAGQIGIVGTKVYYGGVQIGTFSGGTKATAALVVTLNASATPAAVRALMRNIVYSNVSTAPGMLPRTVSMTLTDGDGGTSSAVTKQISLIA